MLTSSLIQEQFNYDETITAALDAIKMILESFEVINNQKDEQSAKFKTTLTGISEELILKRKVYYTHKSQAVSSEEAIASRSRGMLMVILDAIPSLISELSNAIREYIEQIDTSNIELIRKQFLPILNNMVEKKVQINELNLPTFDLPARIKQRVISHSFSDVRVTLTHSLIELAKRKPINDLCPFTQDTIEGSKALYTCTGHKFDILPLLKWQCKRPIKYNVGEQDHSIKYLNPFTNKPFSDIELSSIKVKAILLGINLSFDPEILLQSCEEFSKKDALAQCLKDGNYSAIKLLLCDASGVISNPLLAHVALSTAISDGNFVAVKFLLEGLGVSANQPVHATRALRPPLMTAAEAGHIDILHLLLKKGADVNAIYNLSDNYPLNALYVAASNKLDKEGQIVKLLLEYGAKTDTLLTDTKRTALWDAAFFGNVKQAQLLIDSGAKVDVSDTDGYSILHAAIMSRNLDMVKLLIKAGAKSCRTKKGRDELAIAQELKETKIAEFFNNMHQQKVNESARKICLWYKRIRDENRVLNMIQDKEHSLLAKNIRNRRK